MTLPWLYCPCDHHCPQTFPALHMDSSFSIMTLTSMFDVDEHAVKMLLFRKGLMSHEGGCSGDLGKSMGLGDWRGRWITCRGKRRPGTTGESYGQV